MFVLRLLIVAICAIMLLPMDPTGEPVNGQPIYGQQATAKNFCDRYPKTCAASGELWAAFKLKLAYGIKLARKELGAQTAQGAQPAFDLRPYGSQKLDGRLNEWRPQHAYRQDSGRPGGTLSESDRLLDWRGEGR